MTLEIILFYFFSSLAIISAIMVIGSKNPIHSVLFLILVFCNITGLLIILNVEFLAITFLIVYVGAVAVLFLFVVMMLNIKFIELNENLIKYLPIGGIIALIFFLEIFLIIDNNITPFLGDFRETSFSLIDWYNSIEKLTNIEVIGKILYTNYYVLFLLASLILLVAMIGAIILTLIPAKNIVHKQDIYSQVSRDFQTTVRLYTIERY